jgi:hypothetical protein
LVPTACGPAELNLSIRYVGGYMWHCLAYFHRCGDDIFHGMKSIITDQSSNSAFRISFTC